MQTWPHERASSGTSRSRPTTSARRTRWRPVRLDLTTRLCRDARRARPRRPAGPRGRRRRHARHRARPRLHRVPSAAPRPTPRPPTPTAGLGTDDDPAFVGMHEASARIVQGTLEVCRRVWRGRGRARRQLLRRPAPRDAHPRAPASASTTTSGVGIQWLLDHGADRVAYVDIDVHHGDGVERMFWNDPRVLTISLHENGQHLFPGTGWPADIGGPDARGTAANVALPPGTGGLRVAARHRRGRRAARARLRPRRPRQPARLRHPPARPPRPPRHHRRRAAPRPRGACTTWPTR